MLLRRGALVCCLVGAAWAAEAIRCLDVWVWVVTMRRRPRILPCGSRRRERLGQMLGVFSMWTIKRPASLSSRELTSHTRVTLQSSCVGRFHRYAGRFTANPVPASQRARALRALTVLA